MELVETGRGAYGLLVCQGILVVQHIPIMHLEFDLGKLIDLDSYPWFRVCNGGVELLWKRSYTMPLYAYDGPILDLGPCAPDYRDPRQSAEYYVGAAVQVSYREYRRMQGSNEYSEEWIPGRLAGFLDQDILVAVCVEDEPSIVRCAHSEVMEVRRYHRELVSWRPRKG